MEAMARGPNILLLTSDQQHWNTLGIDNPEIRTPQLDRLAGEGIVLDRSYCPNPTCTPTRASLLTGQYPSQHGAYSLGTKLLEDRPTMNDTWRENGYRSGLVGKAHFQPLHGTGEYPSLEAYPTLQDLDFWQAFRGPFYGFDDFELARNHTDEAHVGQHYARWMEEKGLANWREYFSRPTGTREPRRHTWDLPMEFHYNTWIAERTSHYLQTYREADQPFFLWASFFDPHPSYLVPEPWDRMYDPEALTVPQGRPGEHDTNSPFLRFTQDPEPSKEKYGIDPDGRWIHGLHSHVHDPASLARDIAVYYGMVSCMDRSIGQILGRLEELGLAENTLVVFTSDHGHYYGHHGLVAKGPFHYEDSIRVPMIARWPGKIAAGTRSSAIQSLVDLPATFLAAAGIPPPRFMSGRSQLPVWTGRAEAVRDHALVENTHEPDQAVLRTYVEDRYKLTVYQSLDCGEFFDLREDPGELYNRWDDPGYAAEKAAVMHRFLQAEMKKDVLPVPRTWGA